MSFPTQERLKQLFSYDEESGSLVWNERGVDEYRNGGLAPYWNGKLAGTKAGCPTSKGYIGIRINGRRYMAHRLVWGFFNGEPDHNLEIDHINGNRSDNRIANLRLVTASENRKNQGLSSKNKNGVHGVYMGRKKWWAEITVDGVKKTLGMFEELSDAIAARKAAEVAYGFHHNHGRR